MSQTSRQLGDAAAEPDPPLLVWLLLGRRIGDRRQLTALAEELGWPYQIKDLIYNRLCKLPNLLLGASRWSLVASNSSPLAPPWPDLVVMIGRRSVPVGRWIRARSGGRTRLVQLGRPRAPLELFDLVVTTPQYRVARRPNVLHLAAPVHQVDPAALAAAARAWQGRFDHLPRPRIALLAGGDSPPYRLDPATARRLGAAASAAAGEGSLLVTSSYRMAAAAVDALFDAVSVPAEFYRWRANNPENPFFAYLAAADEFIVTGDSVSMLTEATATGKPVRIFDLPRRETLSARVVEAAHGRIERRRQIRPDDRLVRVFDGLLDRGMFVLPRDFGSFHRWLIAERRAAWLGEAPPRGHTPVETGLAEVAARVRRLVTAETADDRPEGPRAPRPKDTRPPGRAGCMPGKP